MLDKLQFNNLLISNKKALQKVRTNTIKKLIQKIRALNQKLEQNSEDDKSKQRLGKLEKVLSELKKISVMDIMRKVLIFQSQHKPTAILTNAVATPSELALAFLTSNKSMQQLIPVFKTTFNLDDGDDTWHSIILQPSKRRQKTQSTEEKHNKRKETKTQKAAANSRVNEKTRTRNQKNLLKTEVQPLEKNHTSKQTDNGISKLSTLKRNRTTHKEITIESAGKSKREDSKPPKTTHFVDPFFKTSEGENYLSTAWDQQADADDDETAMEKSNTYKFNKKPRLSISNTKYDANPNNSNKYLGKKGSNRDEEVHPSWAAKQKFKPVINNFEGKKLKFSEDNNEPPKLVVNKEVELLNNTDLHPSWEAKQKVKPIIRNFQGKKTVFDDN